MGKIFEYEFPLTGEFSDSVILQDIARFKVSGVFADWTLTEGSVSVEVAVEGEFGDAVILQEISRFAVTGQFSDVITLEHQMKVYDEFFGAVICTASFPQNFALTGLFQDEVALTQQVHLACAGEFGDNVILTDVPYVIVWEKQTPPATDWTKETP